MVARRTSGKTRTVAFDGHVACGPWRTQPTSVRSERSVVGTDGSDPAAEAVAWALEEARRRGLPLHVIAAWSASRDPQETQWLATMKSVAELRGALTDEVTVAVRSVVERGGHHEVPIGTRVCTPTRPKH